MQSIKYFLLALVLATVAASTAHAIGVCTESAGCIPLIAAERSSETAAKVMVNGDIVFTIAGGSIQIVSLTSECITANDATASTMQWQSAPTVGTATTFSGASATLASATAGTNVRLAPTALSTALVIVTAAAGGVQLGTNVANLIIVKDGTIKLVIGVGSTTGTWRHTLRYKPLSPNATVTP